MATGYLTISPTSGSATSSWTGWQSGYNEIRYTTPTVDGFTATVTVPAAMTGAVFQSANLSYSETGTASGTKTVRYKNTSVPVTSENILEKLQNGETEFEMYFSFRATGGTGGEGAHTATHGWSSVSIRVVYTAASSYSGTLTLSDGSSVYYAFPKASLCKGETADVVFGITPAAKASALLIRLGDSTHSSYTQADISISAPTGRTTYHTVNLNIDNSSLASRVNTGYIYAALTTTSGTANSGWNTLPVKFLSSRASPSISVSWSDSMNYNTTYGNFVQGYSILTCSLTISLDTTADSTIAASSRRLTIAGTTYTAGTNTVDVGAINANGTVNYSVSVTDTYGKTGTYSGSITVLEYSPPTISKLEIKRYNTTTYTVDDTSNKVWLTLNGTMSSLNSNNRWTLTAQWTNGSTTNSTTIRSNQSGSIVFNQNYTAFSSYTISASYNWTFTITLSDKISSSSYTCTVSKTGGLFNIEANGVAVGQRSTGTSSTKLFESNYVSKFYKDVYIRLNGTDYKFVYDSTGTSTGTAGCITFVKEVSS